MIKLRVKITEYDKTMNICKAQLLNGDIINLDPYVSAIELSDDDYKAGRGADIVGNHYILTDYSVIDNEIIPHENGMIVGF